VLPIAQLFSDSSFRVLSPHRSLAPRPRRGVLDGLSADGAAKAEWWERHVLEVLTGAPPGSPQDTQPRPQYDPLRHSLRQREVDKVAEMRARGERVSLTALGRMRRRHQAEGLLGLVDGPIISDPHKAVDARVSAALEKRSRARPGGRCRHRHRAGDARRLIGVGLDRSARPTTSAARTTTERRRASHACPRGVVSTAARQSRSAAPRCRAERRYGTIVTATVAAPHEGLPR